MRIDAEHPAYVRTTAKMGGTFRSGTRWRVPKGTRAVLIEVMRHEDEWFCMIGFNRKSQWWTVAPARSVEFIDGTPIVTERVLEEAE